MADLTGKTPAATYKDLLKIASASDNAGLDSTLRVVEDGDATASALSLSTTGALVGGTLTVGSDGSGSDVVFYSGTAGDNFTWDASEEKLTITGTDGQTALDIADGNVSITDDLSVDGTANLDNTDIDGTLVVDGSNISLDSTSTFNIDCANTSNGISIGTATPNVPISIGHTTSEVTVNDNLTVTGDLTINGTTTTINSTTLTVDDKLIELAHSPSGSEGADSAVDGGGIILKSSDSDKSILWENDDNSWHFNQGIVTGVDDTGHDVIFYGATSGKRLLWDESADELALIGSGTKLSFYDAAGGENISANGSGVLSVAAGSEIDLTATDIDINGAVDVSGALTIGGNIDFNSGTIDLSTQTVDVTLNAAVDALNFDSNTLSIDATNNRIGIGTASPYSPFHVVGAGAGAVSDGNSNIPVALFEGTSTSDGSSNPIVCLHNSSASQVDDEYIGAIVFSGGDSGDSSPANPSEGETYASIGARILDETDADTAGQLQLRVSSNDGLSAGNGITIQGTTTGGVQVGIGTDSPNKHSFASDNTVLTISGSREDGYSVLEMGSYATDANDDLLGQIGFFDNMGSGSIEKNATIGGYREAAYKGFLTFSTSDESSSNTTVSERMRIKANGNVGIGDTNPACKLEVGGAIAGKLVTLSATGPTDNVDVSGAFVLKVDSSSNDVTIGGFAGGVEGQVLHVAKMTAANTLKLENNHGGGSQNILLCTNADETVVNYGGWTLVCNGSSWIAVSSPSGLEDA